MGIIAVALGASYCPYLTIPLSASINSKACFRKLLLETMLLEDI